MNNFISLHEVLKRNLEIKWEYFLTIRVVNQINNCAYQSQQFEYESKHSVFLD